MLWYNRAFPPDSSTHGDMLEEVRRRILIALFSDDELMDALVLKRGNALALIYKVGSRASLDMDFSIKNDFDDIDKAGRRIIAALKQELGRAGYVLFDERFWDQAVDVARRATGLVGRLPSRIQTGPTSHGAQRCQSSRSASSSCQRASSS